MVSNKNQNNGSKDLALSRLSMISRRHSQIIVSLSKKYASGDFIILLLYIDDMLIVRHAPNKSVALKKGLNKSFAMKDLGAAKQVLEK